MSTVECAHCGGKGKEITTMSLSTGEIEYRTCSVCNGRGMVGGEESYFTKFPDRSLENAHKLMQQHGKPAEICIAGNHDIRVLFEDGSRFTLGGFTVGYRGTGPDYMKEFLGAAGFDVSIDSIAAMHPPVTLLAGQPYFPIETLEFEAPTIESATTKAKSAVPSNAKVLDLVVIRTGGPATVEVEGSSKEAATKSAKFLLPLVVEFDQETVIREGKQGTQSLQAWSEQEARESIKKQLLEGADIKQVVCTVPVSKGFLGAGRKPGTFEISWVFPWKVAYKYRVTAAVRIRFQQTAK